MRGKQFLFIALFLAASIELSGELSGFTQQSKLSRHEKKLKESHLRAKIKKLSKEMDAKTLEKEQLRRKRDKATQKIQEIRTLKDA